MVLSYIRASFAWYAACCITAQSDHVIDASGFLVLFLVYTRLLCLSLACLPPCFLANQTSARLGLAHGYTALGMLLLSMESRIP
jgi:hypothetical protein